MKELQKGSLGVFQELNSPDKDALHVQFLTCWMLLRAALSPPQSGCARSGRESGRDHDRNSSSEFSITAPEWMQGPAAQQHEHLRQRAPTDDCWRRWTGTGSAEAESQHHQTLSWSSVLRPAPRFPSDRSRSSNPTHRSDSRRWRRWLHSSAPDVLELSLRDPLIDRLCNRCPTWRHFKSECHQRGAWSSGPPGERDALVVNL